MHCQDRPPISLINSAAGEMPTRDNAKVGQRSKLEIVMTRLPPAFKRIGLNLARSKEFPSGSTRHGYEFVAPLDAAGHIDPAQWQKHRENCRVRRFDGDEEDEEAGYRFGSHAFRPGEYVTIRDEDGAMHTCLVVAVEPAA